MADPAAPPPKGKGSGLTAKKGPLPLWAWVLLGAVGLYLVYRWYENRGSLQSAPAASTTTATAPTDTTSTDTGSLGQTTSAGSPTDTGQSTSDLVSALGGQQASLLQELEAQNQDVLGLAQSQIAALQTQTAYSSTNTQTQPVGQTMPGGLNIPIIGFISPSVSTGVSASSSSNPPAAAKPPSQTSTASRYYTYKSQVPIKAGQTVHFRSGKGYYAS